MTEYASGTCLFSGPDTPEVIEVAKAYIRTEGYSNDNVRLLKTGGRIEVIKK